MKDNPRDYMSEEKAKNLGGRPSLYDEKYNEQVFKLCLLGATDASIANFFNVTETTINNWKLDYPTFFESIKAGREEADAKVAQSLYNRALGYVGKKTITATNQGEITDVKVVDEYVGADTTAAIFWLKNRQPHIWRDKKEVDNTSSDGSMTPKGTTITPEVAKAIAEQLKDEC